MTKRTVKRITGNSFVNPLTINMPMTFIIYLIIHLLLLVYLVYILGRLIPLVLYARQSLPFVPISNRAAQLIARLPDLKQARTIIDLGCGTGTLLAAVSRKQRQAQLVGIDFNPTVLRIARWRSKFWRYPPTWHLADMFTYPIGEYDAIIGWWVPDFAKRLLPKFLQECKASCVIVSYMFPLPEHPDLVHATVPCGREFIHIYRRRSGVDG